MHLQHEADSALKKARLLQAQRQEEYEKAKISTSRLEEEQIGGGGGAAAAKQLEKRRRLEEEALQKVQHVVCWTCGSLNVVFHRFLLGPEFILQVFCNAVLILNFFG